MSDATVAEALGDLILDRESFRTEFDRLERCVTDAFLAGDLSGRADDATLNHLLRYADVLSHSGNARHREIAYTTVALLHEYGELIGLPDTLGKRVRAVSEAVLVQLGNFPGIRTIQAGAESEFALPISRGSLRIAKELVQRTSRGDTTLTDSQYAISQRMRREDFFSFSGPTSLGKSFILKDALYDIAQRPELNNRCVVVLVPTKALIGQTAADLRSLLTDAPDVNVATYPSLPRLLQHQYKRTVFVLTPERLLRYLGHPVRDIDYLVIDEAQKVIAKDDTRSSLYYHAIVETTRRFATKLIFASPSITNPELFLELFGKSTAGALAVRERTVAQQRFFVDLVERRQYHFSGIDQSSRLLDSAPTESDAVGLILARSTDKKTIIYVNGSSKSSALAQQLAQRLTERTDEETARLIKYVRRYVHKDYFLGETLKHGVAFHHGKMPQEVRERVEAAFADPTSPVQFVVCTSTLLEGVNLPAKNIFVLSDKRGSRHFTRIDFENLAGRAGRLTCDVSGNVVCVREEPSRWKSTKGLISQTDPHRADSFLVQPDRRRKKPYSDIARVLRGEELPGSPSADARRSIQQYAAIVTLHQVDQQQTPLRSFFIDKVRGGRELLSKAAEAVEVPTDVLRRSPDILPAYQNAVWRHLHSEFSEALLPTHADLTDRETFHRVLLRLSQLYNWPEVESQGTDPLVPKNASANSISNRLWYWAVLMHSWVQGDPLNRVIASSIAYHKWRGAITFRDFSRTPSLVTEEFDATSPKHVNLVIEETLRDIEGGLRFRIISYLQNFHDLSVSALGPVDAGINVAVLVEYGTVDGRAVELQEVGFSRSVANELLKHFPERLRYTAGGELAEIDIVALLNGDGISDDARNEVAGIFQNATPAS